MPFSAALIATLRAVLDRLIPRDDFPGATEAGVDVHILNQLAGGGGAEAGKVATLLAGIEAEANVRHGAAFATLTSEAQDALLSAVESGRTRATSPGSFRRLVELAAEGFYGDPGQGGNRNEVSWRMIGYERRVPQKPTTP